jgi:hypothetical protein
LRNTRNILKGKRIFKYDHGLFQFNLVRAVPESTLPRAIPSA